jgi:hypothetical protein
MSLDAHHLPDRVGVAEQLLRGGGAEHTPWRRRASESVMKTPSASCHWRIWM